MPRFRHALLAAVSVLAFAPAALAADLPTTKGPVFAPPPVPIFTWTGFYVGINGGGGWDGANVGFSGNAPLAPFFAANEFPTSLSPSASGGLIGGQIGYNYQFSPYWVGGIETDLDWANITGSASAAPVPVGFATFNTSVSKTLEWIGTTRVRAGWLVSPMFMVYATGGVAYGGGKLSYSTIGSGYSYATCPTNFTCSIGSNSSTMVGWTLGAGVEAALDAHWSIKAEYLYADLGTLKASALTTDIGLPTAAFQAKGDFQDNIFRAGVNYRF